MSNKIFFVQQIKLQQHIVLLFAFLMIGTIGIALTQSFSPAWQSLLVAAFAFCVFFVYYFTMLYRGVRYDNGYVQWKWGGLTINDMLTGIKEHGFDVGLPDFSMIDIGDNIFGVLIAFILSVLISIIVGIIAVVLIWVGINVVGFGIFMAWIPLYAMARFGIRIALANVRKTKGSFSASFPYALINSIVAGIAAFSSNYVIERIILFFHKMV
jgi:hypothetical protein